MHSINSSILPTEHLQVATNLMMDGIPDFGRAKASWGSRGDEVLLVAASRGSSMLDRFYIDADGTRAVFKEYFGIDQTFQRLGYSSRMMKGCLHAYDLLGVKTVSLEAEGTGGYAWARAGFAVPAEDLDDVKRRLFSAEAYLPRRQADALLHTLETSRREWMMYNVSQLKDGDDLYGRKILINFEWDGYVDLEDPFHRSVLNEVLG